MRVPRTDSGAKKDRGDVGGAVAFQAYAVKAVRVLAITAAAALLAALIFLNLAPWGARLEYHIDLRQGEKDALPSPLVPGTSLGSGEDGSVYEIPEMIMETDRVNFNLDVPYEKVRSARVEIEYRGDPKELLLGVSGSKDSPFIYKPVHNRVLNGLAWNRVTEGPLSLFQKAENYDSVGDFLADPPLPGLNEKDYPRIATYYFDMPQPVPGTLPSESAGGIDLPVSLRGQHSFYILVEEGSIELSLVKHELNWSEGPDDLDVLVYKGTSLKWGAKYPDDGDEMESGALSVPQRCDIFLDGLDSGVYRVDLVCGFDVIVDGIHSEQDHVVFADSVYLADHELYGLGPSRPVTLFTDAEELKVHTMHGEALQTLRAEGGGDLAIDQIEQHFGWSLPPGIKRVDTECGDVVLLSKGSLFAFSADSFFDPFPVKVEEYNEGLLMSDIEYIVADYVLPEDDGAWKRRELFFDLSELAIEEKKLRCSLFSPGLSQANGEIAIGRIDVVLEK